MEIGENTGKVRDICQPENVGTMSTSLDSLPIYCCDTTARTHVKLFVIKLAVKPLF